MYEQGIEPKKEQISEYILGFRTCYYYQNNLLLLKYDNLIQSLRRLVR